MKQIKKTLSRTLYRSRLIPALRRPIIKGLESAGVYSVLNREDWLNSNEYTRSYYGEDEVLTVGEAIMLANTPEGVKDKLHLFTRHIDRPYSFGVQDAILVGPNATGFTSDGKFIRETSFPYYAVDKDTHVERSIKFSTLWQKATAKEYRLIDVAATLFNDWNGNYFEWMSNTLPRLQAIEEAEQRLGCDIPIFVTNKLTSWQKETLKLMGHSKDYYVWDSVPTKVKTLIVPAFRKYYDPETRAYKSASCTGIKWVRDRILSNINLQDTVNTPSGERVYISRASAVGRKVVNEQELKSVLQERLGFTFVQAETLTVSQQANLFNQAKVIIAPHGAGLVNLIYSENSTIVELTGETLPTPAFAEISRGLGLKYGILSCKSVGKGWDSDIQVSVHHLTTLLNQLNVN